MTEVSLFNTKWNMFSDRFCAQSFSKDVSCWDLLCLWRMIKSCPAMEIRKYMVLALKEILSGIHVLISFSSFFSCLQGKTEDFSDVFRHWRDPFQVIQSLQVDFYRNFYKNTPICSNDVFLAWAHFLTYLKLTMLQEKHCNFRQAQKFCITSR